MRVLTFKDWLQVLQCAAITFLRVIFAVILGTLWTVPFGLWIVTSRERLSRLQPIIQMCASFPAPMLYPLVLTVFVYFGVSFNIIAVFLMVLGVQWYILFNVIAGALRIPTELGLALDMMSCSKWNRWRHVCLLWWFWLLH
ncbi:MAG: hypothetical protein JNM39_04705 [Bdellovibrionaceae bacterium]|nr:hypothetical protein [Pseudobdellovibrionaceae bacterium]